MSDNPEIQSKTKRIGEFEYKSVMFPAGAGLEILVELKSVLGDSVGSLMGGEIETAIAKIGGNYSNAEVRELVARLLQWTYVEGYTEPVSTKAIFDTHFAGSYGRLFKVVAFAIEVNYSDFFDELKNALAGAMGNFDALLQKMGATGAIPSPNPSGSNG